MPQDERCSDPRLRDWAEVIDQLFNQPSPAWTIYPHGRGHHIQFILKLVDTASMSNIRGALQHWGWKKGQSDETESWFTDQQWSNPCKQ